MDEEQKRAKRLENLAKARQRIMELREQSKNVSRKTKDETRFKDEIKKVADSIETMEKTTADVVDKSDKKDDVEPVKEEHVKDEPVKQEPAVEKQEPAVKEEPVKEPAVKEKKPKKVYVKKPKPEPILIEEKPVKLSFTRGNDGFWYM